MVLLSIFLQFAITLSACFLLLWLTCKACFPKGRRTLWWEQYFEPRPPAPPAFVTPATEKTRCFRKEDGCHPVAKTLVVFLCQLMCGIPSFFMFVFVAMFCWCFGWAFPKCVERALASSSVLRAVYAKFVPRSRDRKLMALWRAYWRATNWCLTEPSLFRRAKLYVFIGVFGMLPMYAVGLINAEPFYMHLENWLAGKPNQWEAPGDLWSQHMKAASAFCFQSWGQLFPGWGSLASFLSNLSFSVNLDWSMQAVLVITGVDFFGKILVTRCGKWLCCNCCGSCADEPPDVVAEPPLSDGAAVLLLALGEFSKVQFRVHTGPPPLPRLEERIHSEFFCGVVARKVLPVSDALLAAGFSSKPQTDKWVESAEAFVQKLPVGAVSREHAMVLHIYTQEWICYQQFNPTDLNKVAGGAAPHCFNPECSKTADALCQTCGICGRALYCSEACMKQHWAQHKWPSKANPLDCNRSPYRVVNAALRLRNMDALQKSMFFSKLLLLALGGIESEAGKLYRALSNLPQAIWQTYADCEEGDQFCFDNFNSTSTDRVASEVFLGNPISNNRRVLLVINAVASFPVSEFSDYPAEAELVLPPGSQFKVRSVITNVSDPSFLELEIDQLPLQQEVLRSMGKLSESSTVPQFQNPMTRRRERRRLSMITTEPGELLLSSQIGAFGHSTPPQNNANPSTQLGTFNVIVPQGVCSGQQIQCTAPDGQCLTAVIPLGAYPGFVFQLQYQTSVAPPVVSSIALTTPVLTGIL